MNVRLQFLIWLQTKLVDVMGWVEEEIRYEREG
jgi:hypothetical protein